MHRLLVFMLLLGGLINISRAQTLKDLEKTRIHLPNGWAITAPGKSLALGDLPLNIAVSPSKRLFAVTNNGVGIQTVLLFDARGWKLLDSAIMAKAWLGLAFSDDEKFLYASGGNDNIVVKFAIAGNRLVPADTVVIGKPWPERICLAGIAVDDKKDRLYIVTRENNTLYVADTKTRTVLKSLELGGEGYTCLLSNDKSTLFITCWGCNKVILFDTGKMQVTGSVAVGDNPNDMCVTRNGKYLFVANANDNSVSVVDLARGIVAEVLTSSIYPGSPQGSTTNSVALSEDEKTLYIANADNNCLAVFDVSLPGRSKSKGFIPTGWYPTCVRVIGNKILVSNGKGFSSMANPYGPSPVVNEVAYQNSGKKNVRKEQYIGSLFTGTLSVIDKPDARQLAVFSTAVYANTPYTHERNFVSAGETGNPVPSKVGDPSPIRHVFYIIKENRTYDQVLGDMKEGNGDTSLVLFGRKITPNHHAVASEFVLLDNFYVDGEVSADGHNWSMGGYATDFLEKTWPTSYGGRGGDYNSEGTREIANNKDGFIWDFCKRYGITYRTYGEFADDYKPNLPVLRDHFCPYYTSWDQKVRDTVRFNQWRHEFDSLVKAGGLPQLNTLRFINDHTEGMTKDRPTPFVHVADNDLAVGMFVDYLSHSSVWNESVVFIVEDDAQNGPDHVDAHRSVALVAGGFVKKGFVDHTMYSTASMLRTIELILGLPPMSQYDASATPMFRCFDKTAGHEPYKCRPCNVDLNLRNSAENKWSVISGKLDFSREDRVPDDLFNRIIWASVKGEDSQCPAPRRAAFFKEEATEK